MSTRINTENVLVSKARNDDEFRGRLLANPRETIEAELRVKLPRDQEIYVHEESDISTHLVLPAPSKFSKEEREAARTGVASLEFLRKTMYDPAPAIRPAVSNHAAARLADADSETLSRALEESISRGLLFLESTIDDNGAWHCIRFNIADPEVPRHFERPPFISAYCVLALESCNDLRAKEICARTKSYLANTMEYPGLWRYYRHLPTDLDSTTLCSLVLGNHPWILLRRNVPPILANSDAEGRFTTWVMAEGEPNVVAPFRIEADPVVNANVIAYLGDHTETKGAQRWLSALISEGGMEGSSKWYPDLASLYYATTRAIVRAKPALEELRPILEERILDLCDESGRFDNILQTAQALSALHNIERLQAVDATHQIVTILGAQRDDGSWPELLAFGDQSLQWGSIGQIGHAAESVTTAFCIEALTHLAKVLQT